MSDEGVPPAAQVQAAQMVAGVKTWVEVSNAFMYVEIASLVLLFSCVAEWVKSSLMQYALSVACISLGMCLIIQTAEFVRPGFLEKSEKPCSLFLLVWWCIGTGIITFKGPFLFTSNGWFGAWGGLLATVKWSIGLKSTNFDKQEQGIKYLVAIVACSFLLIFSCIQPLKLNVHKGNSAFGIAAGSVSLVACAYLIAAYKSIPESVMKVTLGILFALWACVAGVCTFNGPFIYTGNGYFACWAGMIACLMFGMHELKKQQVEDDVV